MSPEQAAAVLASESAPNTGLLDSSERYRINSVPATIKEITQATKVLLNSEALWLAATCRRLLQDNDRLRVENEALRKRINDRATREATP